MTPSLHETSHEEWWGRGQTTGFGRCDGHHKIVDLRRRKDSPREAQKLGTSECFPVCSRARTGEGPAQRADHDGRRLVCGDRSGRTSAPTSRQAVQTIRRHKERTGISSGSPSAFMTTLRLRSPPRVPIWAAKDDHYDHHVWLWLRL